MKHVKPINQRQVMRRDQPIGEAPLCAHLVGQPASIGVDKSRLAVLTRGRGKGAAHWLSELIENGVASGWGLVHAIVSNDNVAGADAILSALHSDGLITRGAEAHDFSGDAFTASFNPGLGSRRDLWYPHQWHWHVAPGAGNALLGLMEFAK